MKKALFVAVLTVSLTACGAPTPGSYPQTTVAQQEVEDCDFDDMLERDEDCGFRKEKKKKKTSYSAYNSKPAAYRTPSSYRSKPSTYRPSSSSYRSSSRSSSKR